MCFGGHATYGLMHELPLSVLMSCMLSPFISAYKLVSKRCALAWDPNIGENSGEMDLFVRFLIKQLIISILEKAQNYKNDKGPDTQAKSHLFMMNNTYYLLELLAPIRAFQG